MRSSRASGSRRRRKRQPERFSDFVTRIRATGAIVTAKTNTPEMGAGANTRNDVCGATGNPFAPLRNAGGSLRIPAALCGVVACLQQGNSGCTPGANSFSFPANRYLSRQ